MKKLIVSFFSLWTLSVYAQNVVYDQIESNGSHVIMTKPKYFPIEGQYYDFSLRFYESEHNFDWRLTVATDNKIPKDNIVLLKLKNEKEMGSVLNDPLLQ